MKEYKSQSKILKHEFAEFKKKNESILKKKHQYQKDIHDIRFTRRYGRGLGKVVCTEKLNEVLKEQKKFIAENNTIFLLERKYVKEIANFYEKTVNGYSESYRLYYLFIQLSRTGMKQFFDFNDLPLIFLVTQSFELLNVFIKFSSFKSHFGMYIVVCIMFGLLLSMLTIGNI